MLNPGYNFLYFNIGNRIKSKIILTYFIKKENEKQ